MSDKAGQIVVAAEDTGPGTLTLLCDWEWQGLLHKDDRTSPAGYPNMVPATRNECGGVMTDAYLFARQRPEPNPAWEAKANAFHSARSAEEEVNPSDTLPMLESRCQAGKSLGAGPFLSRDGGRQYRCASHGPEDRPQRALERRTGHTIPEGASGWCGTDPVNPGTIPDFLAAIHREVVRGQLATMTSRAKPHPPRMGSTGDGWIGITIACAWLRQIGFSECVFTARGDHPSIARTWCLLGLKLRKLTRQTMAQSRSTEALTMNAVKNWLSAGTPGIPATLFCAKMEA